MQRHTRKSITYKYFHIFKSNALRNNGISAMSAAEEASGRPSSPAAGPSAQYLKNEVDEKVDEGGEYKNFWERQMIQRQDYSMFLFSKSSGIRRFAVDLMNSIFFNVIVFGAICFSIVTILYPLSEGTVFDVLIQVFILSVFSAEIFIKWIGMGWFDYATGEGYFWHLLNVLDFAVCIVVIVAIATGQTSMRAVYIFRLTKFPSMFSCKSIPPPTPTPFTLDSFLHRYTSLHIVTHRYVCLADVHKSRALQLIYRTVSASASSVILYMVTVILFCFFFAVFGLQLWRGTFGYCSYPNYPSFDTRFVSYSNPEDFPHGCDGSAYIPVVAAGQDSASTSPIAISDDTVFAWSSIHWKNPINSFDNIFAAMNSVFRVAMMNEWAPIAVSALSYTGVYTQPEFNHSRASFLFFILVSTTALFLNIVFAAVLFYHYLVIFLTEQQRRVFRNEDVIWLEMMVTKLSLYINALHNAISSAQPSLYYVEPLDDTISPDQEKFPLRNLVMKFSFVRETAA